MENNKSVIFDDATLDEEESNGFMNDDDDDLYEEDLQEGGGIGTAIRKSFLRILFLGAILSLVFLYFWPSIMVVIKSGEGGVKYRLFNGGVQLEKVYDEGLHFTPPWNTIFIYNLRRQERRDSISSLTKDGLEVGVKWRVVFRPISQRLPLLHKNIGPHYADELIKPTVGTAIREVISQFRPQELYSMNRALVQSLVLETLKAKALTSHVEYVVVQILEIKLPEQVSLAIEKKLIQEQKDLEYEYKLEQEKKEAQRKVIEARGIKSFADSAGIDILKWRGIQATEELAKSPNAKIVVIGTDDKNLPIILGGGK